MDEETKVDKARKTRRERGKKLVTIELDPDDYALATANANALGLGITAFGRELLLKKRITQQMSPAQRQMYAAFCGARHEMSKQGANLNQAAKALNTIAKMPEVSVKLKIADIHAAIEGIDRAVAILEDAWAIEEAKINSRKKKP
jgi:hypothetical protein